MKRRSRDYEIRQVFESVAFDQTTYVSQRSSRPRTHRTERTNAKASTDVKVGDELQIRFGNKLVTVVIDSIAEHARKEDAKEMYRLIKEEKVNSGTEA